MTIYDELVRGTLEVKHRKAGGHYATIPAPMCRRFGIYEGCTLDFALLRVLPPPVKKEKEED